MFFWVLSLLACGLDPIAQDTGGGSGSGVDRGDPVDFLVYPSQAQNRILVFGGHGGESLQPYTEVRSAWAADGWSIRDSNSFPSDFQYLRLIVFVDTGSDASVGSTPFSDEEITALTRAMERGTRLVFLQDRQTDGRCGSEAMLQLINAWDVPFVFDQGLSGDAVRQQFSSVAVDAQPLAQVSTITLGQPCTLTSGGSWLVRSDASNPLISQFRPGNAGDMIFIGDVDLLRDGVVDPTVNDNLTFAQNLARVIP